IATSYFLYSFSRRGNQEVMRSRSESMMSLNVLGCMPEPICDMDWGLQLFPMGEEFPVSAGHKLVLIKSLPFVHTTHCCYRLDGLVKPLDQPHWLDYQEVKVVTKFL
uniref:Uncharacterized protein n=1 Tax=Leptobrachium leishanense TaxID=445787 RepID=A0A8C5M7E0_9ANUR